MIDAVDVNESGTPNHNIIVTSKYGLLPFYTTVNVNNILANAGFDSNKVRASYE